VVFNPESEGLDYFVLIEVHIQ